MPGNISQYQVVIPGQIITASLWNGMESQIIDDGLIPAGIDDYSTNDAEMQVAVDPYPAGATSRPTSLQGELERIRFQLDQIIGGTYWYEDPNVSINAMKSNFDAHTHDGTANNGPQLTSSGLASNAVTTAKITDLNVTTAKINDSAVTTAKIADLNVTTGKINDSAVTTVKLGNNAVDAAKLDASVAGNGLAGGGGSALSVNVDNSTIEINSDTLRVKDAGVTEAKLATAVVNKLGQNIGLVSIASGTNGTLVNYTGQGRLLGVSWPTNPSSTLTVTIDGVTAYNSGTSGTPGGLIWGTSGIASSTNGTLSTLGIFFKTSLVVSTTISGNTIYVAYERAA